MKLATKILGILFAVALVGQVNVAGAHADAKVKFNSFEVLTKELTDGDVFKYKIDYTSEEEINYFYIWMKNDETSELFFMSPKIEDGEYDLSENFIGASTGTYKIDMLTFGLNNESYFIVSPTRGCDIYGSTNCMVYDFSNASFKLTKRPPSQVQRENYSMDLGRQMTSPGKKVSVDFKLEESSNIVGEAEEISQIYLKLFDQKSNESFDVYLDENHEFYIPSTAKPGTYVADKAYVKFVSGRTISFPSNGNSTYYYSLWCTGSIEVTESLLIRDSYNFNYSDFSKHVESDIDQLNDNATITVNANTSPRISKNLFEKIQSTRRTLNIDYQNIRWIFYGMDINEPKTVEVSARFSKLTKEDTDAFPSSDLSKAVILDFTNKGDLPGRTIIHVASKEIANYFEPTNLYIYYYDDIEHSISKVAANVAEEGGYYEFYIKHNSKYILTANEMSDEEDVIITDDSAFVENEKGIGNDNEPENRTTLFILLGVVAGVILLAMIVPHVLKKKEDAGTELQNQAATKENGFYDTEEEQKEDEDGEHYTTKTVG